jgi:hypothetical protein
LTFGKPYNNNPEYGAFLDKPSDLLIRECGCLNGATTFQMEGKRKYVALAKGGESKRYFLGVVKNIASFTQGWRIGKDFKIHCRSKAVI